MAASVFGVLGGARCNVTGNPKSQGRGSCNKKLMPPDKCHLHEPSSKPQRNPGTDDDHSPDQHPDSEPPQTLSHSNPTKTFLSF